MAFSCVLYIGKGEKKSHLRAERIWAEHQDTGIHRLTSHRRYERSKAVLYETLDFNSPGAAGGYLLRGGTASASVLRSTP